MSYLDDVILIRMLKGGSRDAYEQAYSKYHQSLIRFAQKYVKSGTLAEDAVQDVFIKLWQVREQLNEHRSLKGFLYTSLKNHVLNLIRDAHQEIYEAYTPQLVTDEGRNKAEEELFYQEYEQIAQKAIMQLPEKRRQIFEMKRTTSLSNNEIAKKLNVSVHTVKSEYYRGSQIVKNYLRKHIKSFENNGV